MTDTRQRAFNVGAETCALMDDCLIEAKRTMSGEDLEYFHAGLLHALFTRMADQLGMESALAISVSLVMQIVPHAMAKEATYEAISTAQKRTIQ